MAAIPSAPFPFEVVGFDLDGTLLDTRRPIAAALNHALVHAGRAPLPLERVVPMVGGGVRDLLDQALAATGGAAPGEVDQLLPVLMSRYLEEPTAGAAAYPGMAEMLRTLDAMGVRLGIVTNKPQALTHATLSAFAIDRRFGCVLGGDAPEVARGKPAPDALLLMRARLGGGRAAFVGDSRYDVAAAKAAGMPVVACRFGFAGAAVDKLGADAVIDRLDDLIPALAAL